MREQSTNLSIGTFFQGRLGQRLKEKKLMNRTNCTFFTFIHTYLSVPDTCMFELHFRSIRQIIHLFSFKLSSAPLVLVTKDGRICVNGIQIKFTLIYFLTECVLNLLRTFLLPVVTASDFYFFFTTPAFARYYSMIEPNIPYSDSADKFN